MVAFTSHIASQSYLGPGIAPDLEEAPSEGHRPQGRARSPGAWMRALLLGGSRLLRSEVLWELLALHV